MEQRRAAPKGWKQTQAPDGRPYWYNAATGETSWQPPGGGPGPTLQLEGSSVELLQVRHPLGVGGPSTLGADELRYPRHPFIGASIVARPRV